MSNATAAGAVRRVVDPVKDYLQTEAAGGLFLLAATVVALSWANSPFAAGYQGLWSTELTIGAGPLAVTEDLKHWVNDGLMALFFFVVGLEIKRELVVGELREPRRASLPVLAALGQPGWRTRATPRRTGRTGTPLRVVGASLGTTTVRTPSSTLACTISWVTAVGNATDRRNEPAGRSSR
jgi:hypothetical protein